MTSEQWRSDPYRHTGLDWQPYVLRFVPGAGTCLVPVQIAEPS